MRVLSTLEKSIAPLHHQPNACALRLEHCGAGAVEKRCKLDWQLLKMADHCAETRASYPAALDLTIGCGAWLPPLLLVAYLFSGSIWLAFILHCIALLINYPHFFATINRVYGDRAEISRYKIYAIHLTIIIVLFSLLAHWSTRLYQGVYTIFINWNYWHFTAQNFGLALLFIYRGGARFSQEDRKLLFNAFFLSFLIPIVTINAGASPDQNLLRLALPESFGLSACLGLMAFFFILGISVIAKLGRQAGAASMLAPALLLVNQFFALALPNILRLLYGHQVINLYYNAGVIAFMHGAQYLWIINYYRARKRSTVKFFAVLIVGGMMLFLVLPWSMSMIFQQDYAKSLLLDDQVFWGEWKKKGDLGKVLA